MNHYYNMATTNNPFGGLFTDKTVQEIKTSLRAHRGALTKVGSEANVWELKPEDWMANLAIAGVVDDEAKKGVHED